MGKKQKKRKTAEMPWLVFFVVLLFAWLVFCSFFSLVFVFCPIAHGFVCVFFLFC